MKVLYINSAAPHSHDYGADNLLKGLFDVLGFANVYDWPEKDCLHLAPGVERDECGIDSDAWYARKGHTCADAAAVADLAILAVSFPLEESALVGITCRMVPDRTPLVAVDYSDLVADLRPNYEALAGRHVAAYFKRELPLGERWGLPLPMSYPIPQSVPDFAAKRGLFYHATDHDGGAPGVPRRAILAAIRAATDANGDHGLLDVGLYPSQRKGTRPSPEAYHARMARALVGLSWNGAPNWDCNRFWENFAYGLAQVAERPRIQLAPYANANPVDGIDCLYADTPEECAAKALDLLREPERARTMAQNGHALFRQWHTSAARARYVLDVTMGRGSYATQGHSGDRDAATRPD